MNIIKRKVKMATAFIINDEIINDLESSSSEDEDININVFFDESE